MKKIILILSIFVGLLVNAQKQRTTITFNNGSVKKGLARIRDFRRDVKFRTKKGVEKEFFDFEIIKSIQIFENGKMVTYEVKYKTKEIPVVKNSKANNNDWDDDYKRIPYLFEVIIKGNVTLYTVQNSAPMMMGANGMMMGGNASTTLYVSKKNEDYVTVLGYFGSLNVGKSFKKRAISFFEDCPDLVNKIKTKIFKKRDIKAVVMYYNSNCGN